MNLNELKKNWNEFGKIDPLWAILTDPKKRGNKWRIDEFFNTGQREIDAIMKYVESLGINIQRRKALDFGCGVGRLTQALANYFDEVYGVDIALSMIELANKYNRFGDKCRYYLNESNDLKLFRDAEFDFIYTNIVLQHMNPIYSKNYIKEFLRILSPHGLLIFQLPSERVITLKLLIINILPVAILDLYHKVRYGNYPKMEMYGIKKDDVVKFLKENNAKIIDIKQDQSAGKWWVSYQYYVTRK